MDALDERYRSLDEEKRNDQLDGFLDPLPTRQPSHPPNETQESVESSQMVEETHEVCWNTTVHRTLFFRTLTFLAPDKHLHRLFSNHLKHLTKERNHHQRRL